MFTEIIGRLLVCWAQRTTVCLMLCHKSPDGDTVGAAYGLLPSPSPTGHRGRSGCAVPDPLPEKFSYIHAGIEMP